MLPFTIPGTTPTQVAERRMFIGMVRSWALMIWSRTTLAESMRSCRSCREEAAKTAGVSMKQMLSTVRVFFISVVLSILRTFAVRMCERRSQEHVPLARPAAFGENGTAIAFSEQVQTESTRLGGVSPRNATFHRVGKSLPASRKCPASGFAASLLEQPTASVERGNHPTRRQVSDPSLRAHVMEGI